MKVSFMAVAVILCSLGCSYGNLPKLEPCTHYPGYLYIFNTSTKTTHDEEAESWMYEIQGSSGAPPTSKIEHHARLVGEVTILEADRIAVYDCLDSTTAAYDFLQDFMTKVLSMTAIGDKSKFTLDVQTLQHEQLLDAIKDAVALWTDDRWVRVCKHKPGYLYIMWIFDENKFGKEWVYKIMGSSGITPRNEINRRSANEPQIRQEFKAQVKDCKLTISSILFAFYKLSKSDPGIQQSTKYGKYTFSVPPTKTKVFHATLKHAIFPNLSKKVPINWYPWNVYMFEPGHLNED